MGPPPDAIELERWLAQSPRLRALARRLLADAHGAEDLVQDAWVAALERPPRERAALGAWLREVVRTLALQRRRGAARAAEREARVARPEAAPPGEELAERLRIQREVLDALLELEEPLRSTVHARYFEGLPPREIARAQAVSVHTVNDRLKRARARLRASLGRRLGGEGAWCAALLPLAALPPRALAMLADPRLAAATMAPRTVLAGELLLMKKTVTTVLCSLAAALLGGGIWWSVQPPAASPSTAVERTGGIAAADESQGRRELAGHETTPSAADASSEARTAVAVDWTVRGRATYGIERPAGGATVRARLWRGYAAKGEALLDERLTADAQGALAWPIAAPAGAVTIRLDPIAGPDLVGQSDSAVAAPGAAPPDDLAVRLYPLDLTVAGAVRDEGGAPVAGAEVRAETSAITDGDGRYRVRATSLRGGIHVVASAPGLAAARQVLAPPAEAGELRCDFTLRRAFVVAGRVVDEHGAPIEGARVRSILDPGAEATSAADGAFALEHLDPGHESRPITVTREGYVPLLEHVSTGSGAAVELELALARGARIEGRVVTSTGAAVAGAEVVLGDSLASWDARSTHADDAGAFVFDAVAAGTRTLWVKRADLAPRRHEVAVRSGARVVSGIVVVLDAGRPVAGRVVDPAGVAVPEVSVRVHHEGALLDLADRTDAEGRFELQAVPDGTVALDLYRRGWIDSRHALASGPQLELVLAIEPAARLAGRVLDATSGEPIESFRVWLLVPAQADGSHLALDATWAREGHAFTDAEGRWDTGEAELPAGALLGVEVRADGYAPSATVLATASSEPEPLLLALEPGRRVRGRVVDAASGAPVAGARVALLRDRREWLEAQRSMPVEDAWSGSFARSDGAGDFALGGFAPPSFFLEVERDGAPERARFGPFDATGGSGELDLLLQLGGARLHGVLRSGGGEPRSGVEVLLEAVEVQGVHHFSRTARTGGDGRFAFDGLGEGYYRVGETRRGAAALEGERAIASGIGVLLRGVREAEVELRPTGSASLEGRLVPESSAPPQALVQLSILPTQPPTKMPFTHPFFATVATDGAFRVEGLPAGTYHLEVRWTEEGGVRSLPPVSVAIGEGERVGWELAID